MYDSDVEALVLEMMKELGIKLTTPLNVNDHQDVRIPGQTGH